MVNDFDTCGHWHVILHLPAKFCSNQTFGGRVMTDDGHSQQSTYCFTFSDGSCLTSGNLFAYQISVRCLSPRLRYYYFWFLNFGGHHI